MKFVLWFSTAHRSKTCAIRLGILHMYALYYPYASSRSHAADIFTNHAAVDTGGQLNLRLDSSSDDAIHGGGVLLLMCVRLLHNRLELVIPNVDVGKRLDALEQDLQRDK